MMSSQESQLTEVVQLLLVTTCSTVLALLFSDNPGCELSAITMFRAQLLLYLLHITETNKAGGKQ